MNKHEVKAKIAKIDELSKDEMKKIILYLAERCDEYSNEKSCFGIFGGEDPDE